MAPLEKKLALLNALRQGQAQQPTHIWKGENSREAALRYCPVCRREDMEVYGETYWRSAHQLPLMTVCPVHLCKLIEAPVGRRSSLNERFYVAGEYCVDAEPDYEKPTYGEFLTRTLYAYYQMPLATGPTEGYSNLAQALVNRGYMTILRKFNITLDHKALYRDLCQYYGPELVAEWFGAESSAIIISRICSWNVLSPERYALLATMIEQPPDITFSPERLPDVYERKLQELRDHNAGYHKKFVAGQLGVKTYQLDSLLRRFNMEPFWVDVRPKANNGENARTELIKAYLTVSEKEALEAYVQEKNFANNADFIRYCLNATMAAGWPEQSGIDTAPPSEKSGRTPADTV